MKSSNKFPKNITPSNTHIVDIASFSAAIYIAVGGKVIIKNATKCDKNLCLLNQFNS
jgi:hypothetical protein